MSEQAITRRRILIVLLTVASTVIGLGCKYYRGPFHDWVNNWGPASVAYELMFIGAFFFVWPFRRYALRIAVGVFVGTCIVEALQLWHPAWLDSIRATTFGRLLLGNTFSWWDYPPYFVGCLLGWLGMQRLTHEDVPTDLEAQSVTR